MIKNQNFYQSILQNSTLVIKVSGKICDNQDNIDNVIEIIKASKNPEAAKEGLMNNFNLSEKQAQAILEMRLQRLTGLEVDKILEEYKELIMLLVILKSY